MKEGNPAKVNTLTVVLYFVLMNSHIILAYLFAGAFSSDPGYSQPLRYKYRITQHTISQVSPCQTNLTYVKNKRFESDIDGVRKCYTNSVGIFLHLIQQDGECCPLTNQQTVAVDRAPPFSFSIL